MALLGRLLFLSVALFPDSRGLNVNIYIDTNVVLNRVQDNFVGVTLDSGIIQTGLGKSGLNLSSPKLLNLAGGFQPNILRIGGTAEDGISFDPNSVTENNQGDLSTSVWDEINAFTSLVGWDLIFGLNVLERRDGQWDPTNAELFLNYTSKKGYQLYGLELGNEPRMFPKKFNQSVSAQQLGKDFGTLEKVLRDRPHFNNTRILGPDVADILSNDTISYVEEFLAAGRASALEGVTFHQWMDKLGMAAQSGIQNVFRQDLYGLGSANRLLESFTYDPLPDYWLTFLFKKLVGNAVFKPRVVGPPTVRAYCHCMRSINPYYYPRGSLTVFAMNLDTVAVNLTFPEYKGGYMDYFLLSPEGDDVQSRTVILNGHQPIHLVENEIPFLVPGGVSANTITLPSLTYGFFVLYADARVCKPGN
ncbi:heparanase-like isoform X2 [Haliotis rufescens]|uniref:heparanase-like isoform X2 n=1 Tax=Haliotis rufescens TaxID=6454 RepID=UPI00201F23E2|nr:heparanase-like isoform X2 [Haliotis rufescens]